MRAQRVCSRTERARVLVKRVKSIVLPASWGAGLGGGRSWFGRLNVLGGPARC